MPSVLSPPVGGFHPTKSSPIRGVITMLPALSPTQTVSRSDGRRSASPDCRIQWHRYRASPPFTSRTSVSRTHGIQRSSPMLGSAVSSSTPRDFQPSSHMGVEDCPVMKRHAPPGLPMGCPYPAVGMQRALESAIGLPRRSTSALWMLVFLMPAEVRRSLMLPPGVIGGARLAATAAARGRRSPLSRCDAGSTECARGTARTSAVRFILATTRNRRVVGGLRSRPPRSDDLRESGDRRRPCRFQHRHHDEASRAPERPQVQDPRPRVEGSYADRLGAPFLTR